MSEREEELQSKLTQAEARIGALEKALLDLCNLETTGPDQAWGNARKLWIVILLLYYNRSNFYAVRLELAEHRLKRAVAALTRVRGAEKGASHAKAQE